MRLWTWMWEEPSFWQAGQPWWENLVPFWAECLILTNLWNLPPCRIGYAHFGINGKFHLFQYKDTNISLFSKWAYPILHGSRFQRWVKIKHSAQKRTRFSHQGCPACHKFGSSHIQVHNLIVRHFYSLSENIQI